MTLRQQGVAHRKNRTVTIVRAHIWTSIRTWQADLDLNTEPAPPGSPALPRSANYERREAVKIAPAQSAHSGGSVSAVAVIRCGHRCHCRQALLSARPTRSRGWRSCPGPRSTRQMRSVPVTTRRAYSCSSDAIMTHRYGGVRHPATRT